MEVGSSRFPRLSENKIEWDVFENFSFCFEIPHLEVGHQLRPDVVTERVHHHPGSPIHAVTFSQPQPERQFRKKLLKTITSSPCTGPPAWQLGRVTEVRPAAQGEVRQPQTRRLLGCTRGPNQSQIA